MENWVQGFVILLRQITCFEGQTRRKFQLSIGLGGNARPKPG